MFSIPSQNTVQCSIKNLAHICCFSCILARATPVRNNTGYVEHNIFLVCSFWNAYYSIYKPPARYRPLLFKSHSKPYMNLFYENSFIQCYDYLHHCNCSVNLLYFRKQLWSCSQHIVCGEWPLLESGTNKWLFKFIVITINAFSVKRIEGSLVHGKIIFWVTLKFTIGRGSGWWKDSSKRTPGNLQGIIFKLMTLLLY